MPKFPLKDFDDNEVFHPRRFILPDKDSSLYFCDFSQVELRVQAYYTILVGSPDYNLCRAYMPYGCSSKNTWEKFDYNNKEHIKRWNSGEWVNKDGSEWVKTDLHSETTKKAFPELQEGTLEFDKARYLGKMTNFASTYGAGAKTLAINLDVPFETAELLRNSYLTTFPGITDYNKKVNSMLTLKGYIENLYGRKYYIENSNNYYKGGNYLIQGSCADMLKEIEVRICTYLRDKKSTFIMAIHDELIFNVVNGEEYIVKDIKTLMESVREKVPFVPIVADVEKTTTNWAEKEKVIL
jgi:DNA polymerase-1